MILTGILYTEACSACRLQGLAARADGLDTGTCTLYRAEIERRSSGDQACTESPSSGSIIEPFEWLEM